MKYLNGKDALKGDAVVTLVGKEKFAVAGVVHELYERNQQVRVSGYNLPVLASDCVLASDAYDALAAPILAKRKADKEAADKVAQQPAPETQPTNSPPA
jgi:hypothetical protein